MSSEPFETVRVTTGDLAVRLNAALNPHPREAPLRGVLRGGAEEPPAWGRLPTARGIAERAPRLRPAHMVPSSYRERPCGVGGLRADGGEAWSTLCCRRGRGRHRPFVSHVQNPYPGLTGPQAGAILASTSELTARGGLSPGCEGR
jgi:hypothetical protein